MSWNTKKILIVTIAGVILELLNYIITNNVFPEATQWIALAIAAITAIVNAIAGINLDIENVSLRAKLKKTGVPTD